LVDLHFHHLLPLAVTHRTCRRRPPAAKEEAHRLRCGISMHRFGDLGEVEMMVMR
jgi:hypothetical protein